MSSLFSVVLIIQDLEEILDLKGKHRLSLVDMQVWALPPAQSLIRMPRGLRDQDAHFSARDAELTRDRKSVSLKLVSEEFYSDVSLSIEHRKSWLL